MEFTFDFQVGHLERALAAARQELANPESLMESLGKSLLTVNRDRHSAGLAPDGSKWKELSPLTLKEPRNGGPLQKTGRMLGSFKSEAHGDTVRLFFDGDRDSKLAAIHHSGTNPYTISPRKAKALKFGGMYRKRVRHPGLPQRQLVGFPDSDQRLAGEVVGDYLRVILNRVR